MYSKFPDIDALLISSKDQLDEIEMIYNQSLNHKSLAPDLLVKVKNYIGNLRSSLDYLRKKVSKNNFPISDNEQDFNNRTADLKPSTKDAIRKYQPFMGNEWIKNFNLLNNEMKHVSLVPQVRREEIITQVTGNGGAISWGSGITFGAGISIMGVPIDPVTQLPIPNNQVKTERITWVNFDFKSSSFSGQISALPFLKDSFDRICTIINEVESTF